MLADDDARAGEPREQPQHPHRPYRDQPDHQHLQRQVLGDPNQRQSQRRLPRSVSSLPPPPALILITRTVNCHKVSLLLDSTVSSLAISSSPSFTVQILGHVPTILIDGTDGGQIYLSKESLGVEIVTAKSSSVNVSLPVEGEEEGVFVEKAVPEQFKTVIREGKLVTSVVEHSG